MLVSLALAAAVSLAGIHYLNRRYSALAENGKTTRGTVLEMPPYEHNNIRVSYTVGSQTFFTWDRPGPPNPLARNLKIGDSVWVYYLPLSPETNSLADPRDVTLGNTIFMSVASFLAVPLLIYAIRRQVIGIR
jgi:hypothetical protein